MKKYKNVWLVTLSLLLLDPAFALESDKNEPIQVEADLLEVDETNNISTYSGAVNLVQGSLNIKADKLIIRFDDNGDLSVMETYGTPAVFNQLNTDGIPMRGQALRLDYDQRKSTLDLMGEAEFEQDGDLIQSQKILINTELDTIDAGGQKEGDRVRMLIKPSQE